MTAKNYVVAPQAVARPLAGCHRGNADPAGTLRLALATAGFADACNGRRAGAFAWPEPFTAPRYPRATHEPTALSLGHHCCPGFRRPRATTLHGGPAGADRSNPDLARWQNRREALQ